MKRTTIHTSAALALLLGFAACTQDEAGFLPEGAEGTPIVFTAMGLSPAATATAGTRAPVDGNWEGVQSVAVRMDGTVKTYDVTPTTADRTSATLTSDEPYYWTNHDDITVTAWWPYTAGETTPPAVVVKADQSARKNFEGSDLIVAEEQTVSYGNPTLRFTHRTARVTVVLTDYTEGLASVRLTGLSTEGGNPAEIAPYDKGGDTYTALVAPQSVATGTAFITCAFTNGKVFVYKMQSDAEWKAGEEYTYTVSLAAADPGYTYDSNTNTYSVYSADGLLAWAKAARSNGSLNCTLAADIDLTGIDWTPIGNYETQYTGTFDGKDKTITGLTVTTSDYYVGLFGYLGSVGTVKNVKLEGVQITSDNSSVYVVGVVGCSWGTIENCSVSGSVSGYGYVGGVAGQNNGTIENCSVSSSVSGDVFVGGVTGRNNGNIENCSVAGSVSGDGYVGGVAGWNDRTIENCSAAGSVSGSSCVGGVAGENRGTVTACTASNSVSRGGFAGGVVGLNKYRLIACIASGSVSGGAHVGGVLGYNQGGNLTACYHVTGSVSGDLYVGGVLGENSGGNVTACYWSGLPDNDNDGATKVDGTTVTWQNAVDAMNTALQSAGSEWRYELTGELPTLKK